MLMNRIIQHAADRPHHPAVLCGEVRLDYRTSAIAAGQLAHELYDHGVRPSQHVALVLGNGPAYVLAFCALAQLGAVILPLNPQLHPREIAHYMSDADVAFVLGHASTIEDLANGATDNPAPCPDIVRTAALCPPSALSSMCNTPPSDAFSLVLGTSGSTTRKSRSGVGAAADAYRDHRHLLSLYSSGSTGRPKRIGKSSAQLLREVDAMGVRTGLGTDDKVFCAIPLFHAHGLGNCLLAALCHGATLVILEGARQTEIPLCLRHARMLQLMQEERVTVFPGVPYLFALLADAPADIDADLSSLRLAFSAGSPLPKHVYEQFQRRFSVPLRQLYGCTEAGAIAIATDANIGRGPAPMSMDAWDSVGHPLPGVDVAIVDDARKPLTTGMRGEIAIRSPSLTAGYIGRPAESVHAFDGGTFYTGDIGYVDDQGRLYITGRKRLYIEIGGHKIDPVEIEDVLRSHPLIGEAVVVGVETRAGGRALQAVVELAEIHAAPATSTKTGPALGPVNGNHPLNAQVVQGYCRQRLANFKVPRGVAIWASIPKSPLGKVLRGQVIQSMAESSAHSPMGRP